MALRRSCLGCLEARRGARGLEGWRDVDGGYRRRDKGGTVRDRCEALNEDVCVMRDSLIVRREQLVGGVGVRGLE